jgi:predicted SnoaL-like aldol condensation-catalyzing enzyme
MELLKKAILMSLTLPLVFAMPASAQSAEQLEENRRIAMEFFRAGITAQERYDLVHPDYIQHNPSFKKYADERGLSYKEGFLQRMGELMAGGADGSDDAVDVDMPAPPENNPYELVIAERDTVTVIQKRYVQDPNEAQGAYYESFWFDTFRVRDGLLYEHWDGALIN